MSLILERVTLTKDSNEDVCYHYLFEKDRKKVNLLFPQHESAPLLEEAKDEKNASIIEAVLAKKALNGDKKAFQRAINKILHNKKSTGHCLARRNGGFLGIQVLTMDNLGV